MESLYITNAAILMRGSRTPIEVKEATKTKNITRARREAELRLPESVDLSDTDLSKLPAAPDHLGQKGADLWYRCAVQLKSVGLLFGSVYEYLESYCRAYELKEEAFAEFKRVGMYVMEGETDTKPGVKRVSQEYKVYNEQIDKMMALGAKLALTPADKSKVSTIIADTTADRNSVKRIGVGG